MKWLRFAILTIVLALIQAGIFANWKIRPDMMLIQLVFFALFSNTHDAIITSFSIGFVADLIDSPMGPHMIAFGVFGTLLAQLHKVLAARKLIYQAVIIFIVGLLCSLLANLLMLLRPVPAKADLFNEFFWIPLLSAVIGPLFFLPMAWWMRIKLRRLSRR